MKKVCFFVGDTHGKGGISRVAWILANKLYNDFEIHVLSYSKSGSIRYIYDEQVKQHAIFDRMIPVHKNFFASVKQVRDYLKKNDIDILICAGSIFYPVCAMAVKGTEAKLICWEHSNANNTKDHKFQSVCRYIGAKKSDFVVALTKIDKTLFEKRYKINNVEYIYNPVDDKLIRDVEYNAEAKRIISVGRLCYQKNFELLVDVAKKVFDKHPDWEWHIFGEGPSRPSIEQKIAENNLQDKLILMGNVSDLYDRYQEYSFLVMTSRYEGFPMTLLESTASGLPGIAFDILTGPNEIIEDGLTGYLVSPYDIEGMTSRIFELIENDELRKNMSDNNVKRRESFREDTIVKQWCELLNKT